MNTEIHRTDIVRDGARLLAQVETRAGGLSRPDITAHFEISVQGVADALAFIDSTCADLGGQPPSAAKGDGAMWLLRNGAGHVVAGWVDTMRDEAEKDATDALWLAAGPLRFGYSYPGKGQVTEFSDLDPDIDVDARDKARAAIERKHQPGRTSRPYAQLVEIRGNQARVAAEWVVADRRWASPMDAGGYIARATH